MPLECSCHVNVFAIVLWLDHYGATMDAVFPYFAIFHIQCIQCNYTKLSILAFTQSDKSIGDTSDIISDSSGVGTNSDSAACSIGHPSTTVVCMQPYTGTSLGHLSIQPGDVIDVVGSTDCGLLEGFVRGPVNRSGFFPEHCVQEVNIRQKNIHNVSTATTTTTTPAIGEYRGNVMMQPPQSGMQQQQHQSTPQQQQPQQAQPQQHTYSSATAPRIKKRYIIVPVHFYP